MSVSCAVLTRNESLELRTHFSRIIIRRFVGHIMTVLAFTSRNMNLQEMRTPVVQDDATCTGPPASPPGSSAPEEEKNQKRGGTLRNTAGLLTFLYKML